MSVNKKYKRSIPGRLVGKTVDINGNDAVFALDNIKSFPAAKSFEPGENAVHPISLNEFKIISALIRATSLGIPSSNDSLLKNKFPASTI